MSALFETFGVSRSSYYAWMKRPASPRSLENKRLQTELKDLHKQSRGTYGAPRLQEALMQQGRLVSKNRVARLMRNLGIIGCAARKFKPSVVTEPSKDPSIARRVFKVEVEQTHPVKPNTVWAGDTTYVATQEGFVLLSVQLDVFTRKIVGYVLTETLTSEDSWGAMREALKNQSRVVGEAETELIAHTDQGSQYTAKSYAEKLERLGIVQSMSRRGNCYDNAYVESFFHTMKVELVHRTQFKTKQEARHAIQDYIDHWYNPKRFHSALGYKSPIDYERIALAA